LSVAVRAFKRRRFLAVALLIVTVVGSVSILTTYYLLNSSNEVTQSAQLGSIFAAHLHDIESKNDSAVTREYEDNATLTIRATTPDNISTVGTHSGGRNISEYWCAHILCGYATTPFTIDNVSYTVKSAQKTALLNATFYMNGTPKCWFRTMVHATLSYVKSGGKWLISDEAWDARDRYGTLCSGVGGVPGK